MNWEVPHRMLKGLNPGYSEDMDEEVDIDLETMLNLYLQARGWDPNTAKPTYNKLISLDLEDVAEDLYQGA
jgi:aldehyde:ferredoxin oxidoreductase